MAWPWWETTRVNFFMDPEDILFGHLPTREGLKVYKYVAPPLSICESLFLDRFWDLFPKYVYPPWLAPNLITTVGGLAVVIAAIVMLIYSPNLEGAAPDRVYLVCGLLVFLYQTLDGSDGKQARATKSGSALGELMDHGVDSITAVLISVLTNDLCGYGCAHPLTWSMILFPCAAFYLSNMVLLHTGRQTFFPIDIQELLLGVQIALVTTSFIGVQRLKEPMIVAGFMVEPRMVLAFMTLAGKRESPTLECLAWSKPDRKTLFFVSSSLKSSPSTLFPLNLPPSSIALIVPSTENAGRI